MSIQPLITFKAGECDAEFGGSLPKIKPIATAGFLYLYTEDDLVHFCWRTRDAPLSNPDLDLVMVPSDGTFRPYTGSTKPDAGSATVSPVNGRIFVLKFSSSSTRHFFWLQSREQPAGDPTKFSQRDLRLGAIVNSLLQGEEMGAEDIEDLRSNRGGDGDGDMVMEDAQSGPRNGHTGPAPSNGSNPEDSGSRDPATGGSGSRRRGTGPSPPTDLHQLLASIGSATTSESQMSQRQVLSTTLQELLTPQETVAVLDVAPVSLLDDLLKEHLPPQLFDRATHLNTPTPLNASDITSSISVSEKRGMIARVLRSPQFTQALASTTSALRDGGLPGVSEALGLKVRSGGWTGSAPGQGQPLTGGAAMEAFIDGAKNTVVE